MPYPSSERLIDLYWLSVYPSCVRWFCVGCALPLSVEVVFVGERSFVLPIVFAPNPQ